MMLGVLGGMGPLASAEFMRQLTLLTPATRDMVVEAAACFRGGADAIVSSNTFPSLPMIDPETLEFEINVDGRVSSGGLGGPATAGA